MVCKECCISGPPDAAFRQEPCFSLHRVRGVVCRHDIEFAASKRIEQSRRSAPGFDGRIPFYAVPELGVVVVVEPEMVHAYFARDMFFREWFMIVEKRHFPCRGEV